MQGYRRQGAHRGDYQLPEEGKSRGNQHRGNHRGLEELQDNVVGRL